MALTFDGTSGSVTFGGGNQLSTSFVWPSASSPFSAAAWVYYTGGKTFPTIVTQTTQADVFLGINIGSIGATGYNIYMGGCQTNNSAAVSTNVWTHIVGTYVSNTAAIYINGVKTAGTSGTAAKGADDAFKLSSAVAGNDLWPGRMADAAFWSAVLVQEEITALARGVLRPHQVRFERLCGFYPLNDISGEGRTQDCSGHGRRGSITNGQTIIAGPPYFNSAVNPRPFRIRNGDFWPGIDALGWLVPATGVSEQPSLVFSQQTLQIPLSINVSVTVS